MAMTVAELVEWLEQNADPDLPVYTAYDGRWAAGGLEVADLSFATTDELNLHPSTRPEPPVRCLLVES